MKPHRLNLHEIYVDPILMGDMTFVIDAPPANGAPVLGDELAFHEFGTRRPFALGKCVYRATITFDTLRLIEVRNPCHTPDGAVIDTLFQAARQAGAGAVPHLRKLAANYGVESWPYVADGFAVDDLGVSTAEVVGWVIGAPVSTRRKPARADAVAA